MEISFLYFLILLFIIIFIDHKNFEREGILFLRRSKRGISIIKRIAKKYKHFLNFIGDLSVIVSFGILSLRYIERKNKKRFFSLLFLYLLFIFSFYFLLSLLPRTYYGLISFHSSFLYALFILFSCVFGIAGFSFFTLILSAISIIYAHLFALPSTPPLQLVVPFSVPKKYSLPLFSVPFDKWIISIFVLVIVHEFAHAILSLTNGIRVKSIGYGFLLFLPLGFAEPDEKKLLKSSSIAKLRVFSAGSFSNFIFGFLFFILFILLSFTISYFQPYDFKGISYSALDNSTPSYHVLPSHGLITCINNTNITSFKDFLSILHSFKPGDNISLCVNNTTYIISLSHHPKNSSLPYIGILNVKEEVMIKENIRNNFFLYYLFLFLSYLTNLMMWISLLNFGIGIANLLPLPFLDGGLMIKEILPNKKLYWCIYFLTSLLLLFSLFGKYILSFI